MAERPAEGSPLLGRVFGLVLVCALPAAGTWWLMARETPVPTPAKRVAGPVAGGAATPTFAPVPLPSGPPGQGVTFALQADPETRDVRGFDRLALCVPEGQPASDFLPPGPFTATFRGTLKVPTRARYRFTFVGTGSFTLRIGEREVVVGEQAPSTGKRVRLKKGEHPLVGVYRAPARGPALLRVYWQSGDFAREPIPARQLGHGSDAVLSGWSEIRRGRSLVYERRCGACHSEAGPFRPAPGLVGVGARFGIGWLVKWLYQPAMVRHGTSMPAVLQGDPKREAIDIAAFLARGAAAPVTPKQEEGDRKAGGEIFADFGCISCHTLSGHRDASKVHGRVPLDHVRGKYRPGALIAYLRDPDAHYPGNPMPDFGLDAGQARQVAVFLRSLPGRSYPVPGSADPDRGAQLLAERGCAACHGIGVPNRLRAPAQPVAADGGVRCGHARYAGSSEDEAAIRAWLTRVPLLRERAVRTPVEQAARELERLRCYACHDAPGRRATRGLVEGELRILVPPDPAAGPSHAIPPLTTTGARLRTGWLTRWLRGEVVERPRPWLAGSMPVFALDAEGVARGLSHAHGYLPTRKGAPGSIHDGMKVDASCAPIPAFAELEAPVAELRKAGQALLPQDGGFGCTGCHAVGKAAADQVFEAPGINLGQAADRLRKEWYVHWMWDPTRIDPTTKMTRFLDPDGRSGLTDVLDGDGATQVEAIWRYLQTQRGR